METSDLNVLSLVSTETQLPLSLRSVNIVPISTASQVTKLLLIDSNSDHTIVYDLNTKTFTKPKHALANNEELIEYKSNFKSREGITFHNLKVCPKYFTPNCILIYGTAIFSKRQELHNSVLYANRKEFITLLNVNTLRCESTHIFNHKNDLLSMSIHTDGCQTVLIRNWLFISGGHEKMGRLLVIKLDKKYNYNNNYNNSQPSCKPLCVKELKLKKEYSDHGCVCLQYIENNETPDQFEIKLLLFGGDLLPFVQSFLMVDISVNDTTCQVTINSQQNMVDEMNIVSICKMIEDKDEFDSNVHALLGFSYHLISSSNLEIKPRYLFIIGGWCTNEVTMRGVWGGNDDELPTESELSSIVYYDFKHKEWGISEIELPSPISYHSSVMKSNCFGSSLNANLSGKCMYIMGGYDTWERKNCDFNFKVDIYVEMKWQRERLIWIAFYKNKNNKKCFVDRLSKDVVKYIVQWSQWSIFDKLSSFE